jgi:hypothetical protein
MTAAQLTLGGWAPPLRSELGQWHTPADLAAKMVAYAGVRPGMRVLEPSAGGGAIVRPLLAAGARVTAVEIDPAWCRCMREDQAFSSVDIVEGDFLRTGIYGCRDPRLDIAVMNPDLDGGRGPAHVWQALHFVARVVSLLRAADLCGMEHHRVLWSRVGLSGLVSMAKRPIFGGDGGKTDFVVVDVWRDMEPPLRRPEWWG